MMMIGRITPKGGGGNGMIRTMSMMASAEGKCSNRIAA
jgi:hypothetical protein